MSLNDDFLNELQKETGGLGNDDFVTPAASLPVPTPRDDEAVITIVTQKEAEEPTEVKLTETELLERVGGAAANVSMEDKDGNASEITLSEAAAKVLSLETISRVEADQLENTVGGIYSDQLMREEFTESPTKTNLQEVRALIIGRSEEASKELCKRVAAYCKEDYVFMVELGKWMLEKRVPDLLSNIQTASYIFSGVLPDLLTSKRFHIVYSTKDEKTGEISWSAPENMLYLSRYGYEPDHFRESLVGEVGTAARKMIGCLQAIAQIAENNPPLSKILVDIEELRFSNPEAAFHPFIRSIFRTRTSGDSCDFANIRTPAALFKLFSSGELATVIKNLQQGFLYQVQFAEDKIKELSENQVVEGDHTSLRHAIIDARTLAETIVDLSSGLTALYTVVRDIGMVLKHTHEIFQFFMYFQSKE